MRILPSVRSGLATSPPLAPPACARRSKGPAGRPAQEGYCFTLTPGSPWNDDLLRAVVNYPRRATAVAAKPLAASANGFCRNAANAPVEITVGARRGPAWQLAEGVAPPPTMPRDGGGKGPVDPASETFTFIPHGCTKLCTVALPVVP